MKMTKKLFVVLGILGASAFFFSCASAGGIDDSKSQKSETDEAVNVSDSASTEGNAPVQPAANTETKAEKVLPPAPAKLTEAPRFDFTGDALKIELENMYYDGFDVVGDFNASGSYALTLLNDSSWAIAEVNFPAGTYEAVANVLAPDSSHSRFNLYINKDTYLLYGSEPPIGKYELTTRAPASFTLDAPTTVTVKIQQNDLRNPANNGQNGMTIDYISFKKK